MPSPSALSALKTRRADALKRLRTIEGRIHHIRSEMALLDQLEVEAGAAKAALEKVDAAILRLDPQWRPTLPRGRPTRDSSLR